MARSGQISGHSDARMTWSDHEMYHGGNSQVRVGSVAVTILDIAVNVTFSSAMNNDYQVFLQPQSNITVSLFPSTKRPEGFTLNLSAGVNATISYIAIEDV